MVKKILLTKKYFIQDIKYFKSNLLPECELINPPDFDEKTLLKYCSTANVFLGNFITKDLLLSSENLELIQIPWTGVDKFNFELLRYTKAVVCNSHSNSNAVAEFAVSLFLSMVKNIPYHDRIFRNGNWNRPLVDSKNKISPFSPMVSTLTVGIMGFGSVGSKISKFLEPFGCSINIFVHTQTPEQHINNLKNIFTKGNIDLFLKDSDVVFVCLPLTDETKNLLSKDKLTLMKKNSYIINVARGEIINEQDLFESCATNNLAGAAIDTWWSTPVSDKNSFPSKYDFQDLDNVIMSPHRAGMVSEALPHLEDAVRNINHLAEGKPLINVVNIGKKY